MEKHLWHTACLENKRKNYPVFLKMRGRIEKKIFK